MEFGKGRRQEVPKKLDVLGMNDDLWDRVLEQAMASRFI